MKTLIRPYTLDKTLVEIIDDREETRLMIIEENKTFRNYKNMFRQLRNSRNSFNSDIDLKIQELQTGILHYDEIMTSEMILAYVLARK